MIQEVVYITNQKEIPKDYAYDTETSEFWVYRNKYTGKELHLAKTPPLYVDVSKVVLQALEDVRAEIEDYDVLRNFVGASGAFKLGVTKGLDLSAEIINRKIKEIENDRT